MKSIHLQKYIGQRIRIIRKEKNLSQQNLSEKAGVGIDYISNLETKGSNIKIDTLEKIITALNITIRAIWKPYNPKESTSRVISWPINSTSTNKSRTALRSFPITNKNRERKTKPLRKS